MSAAELGEIRKAGLDRIHIGMESGSDRVLKLVRKGVGAKRQIEAGKKVIEAGMELSGERARKSKGYLAERGIVVSPLGTSRLVVELAKASAATRLAGGWAVDILASGSRVPPPGGGKDSFRTKNPDGN